MFIKLFCGRSVKPAPGKPPPAAAAAAIVPLPPDDNRSLPLRVVHAGGFVEYYYMAVPAIGIMNKYPSEILARPDVFRRPWESIVRPDEILTPGEKFYFVPRNTLRKLRHRIRRTADSDQTPATTKSQIDYCASDVTAGMEGKLTDRTAPLQPLRKRKWRTTVVWRPTLPATDETSPLKAPPPPLRYS